ncbi:MAG: mechanosensitive ion channel family protein [Clostridiales bacterium]|nr:mechanosensitive ion channel family protein [Clostridiales bacterium]
MDTINAIKDSMLGIWEFIKNPEQLTTILGSIIKAITILVVAKISIKLIQKAIDVFFESQAKLKYKVDIPRVETMKGLMKSIIKYTIYFIAVTAIFRSFGTDVTALITAAGIGGLAFGFGAQNLVRDVITGFFILFEDQFGVGDYVEIDGTGGIVEEMALRVTKIRDFNGDLNTIPNGEIKKVTNRSMGNMRAWVNISIAYEEDIDNAIAVLQEACRILKEENDTIVEGPTVLGVTNLGDSDVVLSIIAKTTSMQQWSTERKMRKAFKEAFDKAGIEIPYPRRYLISEEKNAGQAT